ncbi:MAG: alginate lyase family protein [Acidobacteria bacterium]|nr:alginate lyase family protein [Acidobacteriota bacterium]
MTLALMKNKLNRLCAMSAAELSYRAGEKVRAESDRMRCRLRSPVETYDRVRGGLRLSQASIKKYLQQGPADRFYFPGTFAHRGTLRSLVESRFPEWKRKAVEQADRLCDHRVEILGFGERQLGRTINWHADPVRGRCWPVRFWADYDLVGDPVGGDPKCVHELNRHQHLPRLAKAYYLTGEERYAREAVAQMRSWIEQNPPGYGVNWHSSLEIAIRAISWLWTICLLLPSPAFDENSARGISCSLLSQLDHVNDYPSIYSSPNTHLIGEAAAVFMGGLMFTEYRNAARWRDRGASLLISEMKKQVSEEGVHGELSTYYHCYTLDFYLQAMLLARHNGFAFPDWMWQRLERMTEFVMHLTRPNGTLPLLGDDDGGRALALDETSYSTFNDALCCGAALFRRSDFKYLAGRFYQETFWLMGEPALSAFDALASRPATSATAYYPGAGYFIQRSDWTPGASQLIFDCGSLGIINGGHGHADALAITLHSSGHDLLTDPGTYTYNGGGHWRNFLRGTRAHNTVVVDGRDQSEPGGTFQWRRKAKSRLVRQRSAGDLHYLEGEHDGYANLGVTHRRRVFYFRPHYWIIADEMLGSGTHDFDAYYHFGCEIKTELRGCGAIASAGDAGLHLAFQSSAVLEPELVGPQMAPIRGWVSNRYGEKHPSASLRLHFRSETPAKLISVLLPFNEVRGVERWRIADLKSATGLPREQALGYVLSFGAREDYVLLPTTGAALRLLGCTVSGEYFWFCTERGVLQKIFGINVRTLQRDSRNLLPDNQPTDVLLLNLDESGSVPQSESAGDTDHVRDMRHREFQRR